MYDIIRDGGASSRLIGRTRHHVSVLQLYAGNLAQFVVIYIVPLVLISHLMM